jgi:CelD/BcsL family acetyltransferase involved in cellulose biosynthesis
MRLVEFADATMVDYNLPILAADWAPGAALAEPLPGCRDHARALWQAVRSVLQPRHDAVRLQKMPGRSLDDRLPVANPLTLGPGVLVSEMFGNQVDVSGDWDAWRHSLNKRVRKEFERSWRVFTRSPEARFERITDPAQAMPVFEELERLQSRRMQHLGDRYRLDQAAYRDFYRRLLASGLADGSVVLTALRDGERLAAAQLGVRGGNRYVALRLATGGEEWKHCSPGRLSCERTGHHLQAQGLRWMDFGIGDYFHKDIFQGTHIPLFDACEALSWRGVPWVRAWHWRQARKRAARAAPEDQSQR